MKLSPWAYGDEDGISTYPAMLLSIGGARLVHIDDGTLSRSSLCGATSGSARPVGLVEYIGRASDYGSVAPRRPVCSACRQIAEQRS